MTVTRFNDHSIDLFDRYRGLEFHIHDRKILALRRHRNICHIYGHDALQKALQGKKEKILWVWFGDCIPGDLDTWQAISDQCQRQGRRLYMVSDSLGTDPGLPGIKFYLDAVWQGIYHVHDDRVLRNNPRERRFSCFVQRIDVVRQTWLYELHARGLLTQGWVSFLYKQLASDGGQSHLNLYHRLHESLKDNPLYDQCYRELQPQIPFVNIENVAEIEPYIETAKYGVSIDTYATKDRSLFRHATAQSMRLLQYPCLPLLFVQQNTVQEMRNLGLVVPDYHSVIDAMPVWQDRQDAILDILCQDSVDADNEQCLEWASHNRALFRGWRTTLEQTDYIDQLFASICED